MKKLLFLTSYLLLALCLNAQQKKEVLFLGNSYTYFNDLPKMLQLMASSTGDSLIYDQNTPGGYQLIQHVSNSSSISKATKGTWDFVVIQEQSQKPSFRLSQVEKDVFPYGKALCDTIYSANKCTKPIFFMTWGRKNGDASNCQFYTPLCTYEGMQLELRKNYLKMAKDNNAFAAPVGMAWRLVRSKWPNIELYNSDESHPSLKGSYLSACVFYAVIFNKNPESISHLAGIPKSEADSLQWAARTMVFDSLSTWNIVRDTVKSNFSFVTNMDTVKFTNLSSPIDSLRWNFGDGTSSTQVHPTKIYGKTDSFKVTLTAHKGCVSTVLEKLVVVTIGRDSSKNEDSSTTITGNVAPETIGINVYPNPATNYIQIELTGSHIEWIQIRNSIGQIILKEPVIELKSITLDILTLDRGLYLLEAGKKDNMTRRKLLLQ